jgi:hypothetical protein
LHHLAASKQTAAVLQPLFAAGLLDLSDFWQPATVFVCHNGRADINVRQRRST